MKKKILAISICVCICFALLAIPAFATSVPETTSAPNVFGTLFDTGSGIYYTYPAISLSSTSTPKENVTVYTPFSISTSGVTTTFEQGDLFRVSYVNSSTRYVYKNNTNLGEYSGTISSPAFYESSYLSNADVTVQGTRQGNPAGLVPELADEVFSVGNGLISFVMSHWIVLIPVVAFLVILCIGAIRKIIKGV